MMDILRCENAESGNVSQHPERKDQNHACQPDRSGQVYWTKPRENEHTDIFMDEHYERGRTQYEQQHVMRERFRKSAMKDILQRPACAAARTVQSCKGIERAAESRPEANVQI